MTTRQDAVINELKLKVEKLIKLYIASLEKNKSLENQLSELAQQVNDLKSESRTLNDELKNQKVASAISGGEGSYQAKLRINQLVREIDKCIALLNN